MNETDFTPVELTLKGYSAKQSKPSDAISPKDSGLSYKPMIPPKPNDTTFQSNSVWRIAESGVGHIEILEKEGNYLLSVTLNNGTEWQVDCSKAFTAAVEARAQAVAGGQLEIPGLQSIADSWEKGLEENVKLTNELEKANEFVKEAEETLETAQNTVNQLEKVIKDQKQQIKELVENVEYFTGLFETAEKLGLLEKINNA